MLRLAVLLSLVITAFVIPASAFEVQLYPPSLVPGDPFVLTVHSNPEAPRAEIDGRELAFGSCGNGCYVALGALGVDIPPGTHDVVVSAGEETQTVSLSVYEGTFPTQRLTLPDDKVFLSPEDEARTEKEAEKMSALWATVTPELRWEGAFIMPLENSLSTEFGTKRIINGKKKSVHRGVDIRGKRGEPVRAANTGRVTMAEDTFYGGNTVIIDHGLGVHTVYMHMERLNVEEGEYITKGDIIGFVGSTGRSTGPHLHYGLKMGTVTANPVTVTRLPL